MFIRKSIVFISILLLFGISVLILWAGKVDNKYNISIIDPIIIAEGDAILASGDDVKIILEMIQGEYFHADALNSPFQTNFEGKYQFRVKSNNTDEVLFKEDVEFETEVMCFSGMFDIVVDDYNADGNPDFVIGQHGGGNYNIFKLYTVQSDGTVKASPIETDIMMIASKDFSMRLNKVDSQSFFAPIYDNEKAELVDVIYVWDGKKYKRSQ